jgi:DNA invertase Pin-like site-specific DNA recombinase
MGRHLTTGKYETREELVDNVCAFYDMCHTQTQVARITGISQTTVANILTDEYVGWKYKKVWRKEESDG